jgi:hypothetical protein
MKTPRSIGELLDNLHDFKRVLQFEYRPAGWYPDEDGTAEEQGPAPEKPGPTEARRQHRRQERRSKGSRGR